MYKLISVTTKVNVTVLVECSEGETDTEAIKKGLEGRGLVVRSPDRHTTCVTVKNVPDNLNPEMRARMEAAKRRRPSKKAPR